jgi:hypothetical protein
MPTGIVGTYKDWLDHQEQEEWREGRDRSSSGVEGIDAEGTPPVREVDG